MALREQTAVNRLASATCDIKREVKLVLEDGIVFTGTGFGHDVPVSGEVVFTTGMVGYPETLTDPSYRGQIVVFTYPLIGNYGVPAYGEDRFGLPVGFESSRVQAAGVVVSEHAREYSHHLAVHSLEDWLCEQEVPGLCGIDTRALTQHLRTRGAMLGKLVSEDDDIAFSDPNARNLAAEVTIPEVRKYTVTPEAPTVLLIDCGCKANIVRSLLSRGLNVICVPYDHYFLNLKFDALVISNGPGDPQRYEATVQNVARSLALGKPMLGICLGHQLLALAVGGDTYKLKFGHRSHNQPSLELNGSAATLSPTGRCVITSQNHGYAVREQSLPSDWRLWFVNANDGTVEGIRHVSKPFMAVQFHPEATPGPADTKWIFDEFAANIRA